MVGFSYIKYSFCFFFWKEDGIYARMEVVGPRLGDMSLAQSRGQKCS